jgi:hypothetical protein
MLTFIMIVTIWMGPAEHKFRVHTAQRFYGMTSCVHAMDDFADKIRPRLMKLRHKPRFEIARQCISLETRET